jgi:outer membrane biosynthesis protein TonB
MKYFLFNLAFVAISIASVAVQSVLGQKSTVVAAPETKYLVSHQEADSRFITSIERIGRCELPGTPLTSVIRVPSELYPRESVEKHEEGTAKIQLIFDSDWCVRKATITQSSGYWRLDGVSLRFAMTIKFTPKKTFFTADGEPTVTIPMAWGASQGRR